jgi:hypothetical protein
MLLQLHSGRVEGYTEGQEPLIYLVSTVQAVVAANCDFVFSDGHGIAIYTGWFADISALDRVDWSVVYLRYWNDTPEQPDRQRLKQAEFLVHRHCPWALIHEIVVIDDEVRQQVELLLQSEPTLVRPVRVQRDWYIW